MKRIGLMIAGLGMFSAFSNQTITEKDILTFYANLNKGDSTAVRNFLHPTCRVKHVDKEAVWDLSVDEFMGVCQKFESDYYEEDVTEIDLQERSAHFIYADIYFDFYIEGTYSHSGVDHFCWSVRDGNLLVESVYSTNTESSKRSVLKEMAIESMHDLMNDWHRNVATFQEEAYYDFMSDQFIFLGTDPSERWTKEEFITFCKPYFAKKKTWDFKTNWRNFYHSVDNKVVWFEESLDTQMEECRGSGVIEFIDGEWKISHYNLSVVIENEKMKKFIKLRRK